MNAFVCVFYSTKGCIPISNDCIYACFVIRIQLLGDTVLVTLLVIPRYQNIFIIIDIYNDPLYLALLRSLFGPFSLFDIIELHAFYVV